MFGLAELGDSLISLVRVFFAQPADFLRHGLRQGVLFAPRFADDVQRLVLGFYYAVYDVYVLRGVPLSPGGYVKPAGFYSVRASWVYMRNINASIY